MPFSSLVNVSGVRSSVFVLSIQISALSGVLVSRSSPYFCCSSSFSRAFWSFSACSIHLALVAVTKA